VKKLKLKPHHLLDILKLYGKDLSRFVPDKNYGHDFHRIGNLIIENSHVLVRFTLGADEICFPCKYLDRDRCVDVVKDNPARFRLKEKWNKRVDKRLFKLFEISREEEMTALAICSLALKKLTPEKIFEVWKERPQTETEERIRFLIKGLVRYSKMTGV
jgi:hypothetical protein